MSEREFLTHLIDYAGMYPPASLSLAEAVRNYATYLHSPDACMLGRFVMPAADLQQVEPIRELFEASGSFVVAALGEKLSAETRFETRIELALTQMAHFNAQGWGRADVLEAAWGIEEADVMNAAQRVQDAGAAMFFVETGLENLDRRLDALADADAKFGNVAMKLRTGGVTANAFPSSEQVAVVLEGCRTHGLRLKFTAGLHHAVRRYDASVESTMHGFVNVFGAGLLAYANELPIPIVCEILADTDADAFQFGADGLAWREWFVSNAEITRLREMALVSFGSCSFDEPRDEWRMAHGG